MANATMLARRQVRLAVLASLVGPDFDDVTIDSPGDWSTPPEDLPAILVRASDERKESINKGLPEFTTTVAIEIEARVSSTDAGTAQDRIEALCYQIELAILTNQGVLGIVNQVSAVDAKSDISADGMTHFGAARMTFSFELPEMFEPVVDLSMTSIGIHFDAVDPFDATGNYNNTLFPGTTAPRTAGPDGRDEGALDIQLPQ